MMNFKNIVFCLWKSEDYKYVECTKHLKLIPYRKYGISFKNKLIFSESEK